MKKKGQIVEIPISSPHYHAEAPTFHSKEEALVWKSRQRTYSLFDGFLVGEHLGIDKFEWGQRKGIHMGGKKEPLYVIGMDAAANRLFVGQGQRHPGLYSDTFSLDEHKMQWIKDCKIDSDKLTQGVELTIKSALYPEDRPVTLYQFDQTLYLEFSIPVLIYLLHYSVLLLDNETIIAHIITTNTTK